MMQDNTNATKTSGKARGLMAKLFVPSVGASIAPMRFQTRMFTQLVAMVFAIYGLFPLDHPFLKNQNEAPMSLMEVITTAYSRVRFTRQTFLQPIIFFAVVGIMIFGVVGVAITALTLFSTKAHASAFFDPAANDLAASWLNYLFRDGSMITGTIVFGDVTSYLEDPLTGYSAIQAAFISALAFYSNAILLIAGILLFYHLVVMIAETAHHGEVMGKKANKIWAPIRLVFAIGLLVPINSGLNTGQYIVVRVAELGSGLASNTWKIFLNALLSIDLLFDGPTAGVLERVALDLIRIKACTTAWNKTIEEGSDLNLSSAKISESGKCESKTTGGLKGNRCGFTSNSLKSSDICGAYFIPEDSSSPLSQKAAQYQKEAIESAMSGSINTAAQKITDMVSTEANDSADKQLDLDNAILGAVGDYQKAVIAKMMLLAAEEKALYYAALTSLGEYGWALAGAFVNTISRVQADMAILSIDSMPRTERPKIQDAALNEKGAGGDVYRNVTNAMDAFDVFASRDAAKASGSKAQCSMMAGLDLDEGDGTLTSIGHALFGMIDWQATMDGVWTTQAGIKCGIKGPGTFHLGIFFGGKDPLSQMSRLGYNMLKTAFAAYAAAMAGDVVSAAAGKAGEGRDSKKAKALTGGAKMLGAGFKGLGMFIGSIFMMTGFSLAFIVPLLPFMYFFFAVLTWVVAVIEAVIAVPLICLAQLNPEGDGLPGKARKAFFFIFNIFLRPTMTVFGLIVGLLVLYVALSYLNFSYMIAVAGAGGTSYGLATIAKIVYTALYCIICYIIANHSFKIIEHIPANALNWMGESAQAMHNMGDMAKIEQLSLIMSSTASGSLMPMMGQAAHGMGGAMGGLFGKPGSLTGLPGVTGMNNMGGPGPGGVAPVTPTGVPPTPPPVPPTGGASVGAIKGPRS